jgi:hypothetical protein
VAHIRLLLANVGADGRRLEWTTRPARVEFEGGEQPVTLEEDADPIPPTGDRVAARAMVLAAVSCRAAIEKDAHNSGAEDLRQQVVEWIQRVGVAVELEPSESALRSTPLGRLERKTQLNELWKSEGMVVLAWALSCATIPPFHHQCEPSDVANDMGFLGDRRSTALNSPRLRDSAEIESWADTYLTLHWRLRQFSAMPVPIDFVSYVSACTWGPLRLNELEIQQNDLAINRVRIDKVEPDILRQTLSIVQERHQAFNWLLGLEKIYSAVTTDT